MTTGNATGREREQVKGRLSAIVCGVAAAVLAWAVYSTLYARQGWLAELVVSKWETGTVHPVHLSRPFRDLDGREVWMGTESEQVAQVMRKRAATRLVAGPAGSRLWVPRLGEGEHWVVLLTGCLACALAVFAGCGARGGQRIGRWWARRAVPWNDAAKREAFGRWGSCAAQIGAGVALLLSAPIAWCVWTLGTHRSVERAFAAVEAWIPDTADWLVIAAALGLVSAFASSVAVRVGVSRAYRVSGDRPADCIACGYSLTGLPTDVCPECGRVNRAGARRPMTWRRVAVWCAAWLVIAAAGHSVRGWWWYVNRKAVPPAGMIWSKLGQANDEYFVVLRRGWVYDLRWADGGAAMVVSVHGSRTAADGQESVTVFAWAFMPPGAGGEPVGVETRVVAHRQLGDAGRVSAMILHELVELGEYRHVMLPINYRARRDGVVVELPVLWASIEGPLRDLRQYACDGEMPELARRVLEEARAALRGEGAELVPCADEEGWR